MRLTSAIRNYLKNHLQASLLSLGRICRAPLASFMTVAVIGIALALPTGLHVGLIQIQNVSAGWENAARISLFLEMQTEEAAALQLLKKLEAMPEIETVTYLSPADALAEFRELSGFGDALDALTGNPLPAVMVLQPDNRFLKPAMMEGLLERLRKLPDVDMVQLDMEWLNRLYALIEIGKRAVLVLASLLALAVLLIIGNTIRLMIQNRRDEIEVQKLIGATDAFIRRPFLYSGIWHGLFGAVVAWCLVKLSLWLLQGPIQRLSILYESSLDLDTLGLRVSVILLISGLILGLFGAWAAVGRHLREIEPG